MKSCDTPDRFFSKNWGDCRGSGDRAEEQQGRVNGRTSATEGRLLWEVTVWILTEPHKSKRNELMTMMLKMKKKRICTLQVKLKVKKWMFTDFLEFCCCLRYKLCCEYVLMSRFQDHYFVSAVTGCNNGWQKNELKFYTLLQNEALRMYLYTKCTRFNMNSELEPHSRATSKCSWANLLLHSHSAAGEHMIFGA